jgi:aminoglycoside 6-adenylyltransferase
VRLAEQDENIRAVIAIGSSVRSDVPADEFSDLDLIIATRDTEKWYSGEYPNRLGDVSISFIEPTLGGGRERRCIYDDD